MKKRNIIAISLMVIGIGTYSIFGDAIRKTNLHFIFGTDNVRIDLVDEAQTNGYVVPGQVRDIDMRVQNLNANANIRWKGEMYFNDGTGKNINEDLLGVTDEWKLEKDGYYYSTTSIESEKEVEMFESLRMPTDIIDDMQEGERITVIVTAEAVQSANFDSEIYSTETVMEVEK